MKKPEYYYKQCGVIPLKKTEDEIKVCLIKNRSGKKWILPKGIREKGKTYIQTAEQEAFEEAGIKGLILPQKIRSYSYPKWKGICKVDFYIMIVKEVYNVYPEDFRKRKLVSVKKAEKMLNNKKLFSVIKKALKKIQT
jgi:8-oxo-dGTP pyrophosphatase MutT (NUDIX family)